MHACMTTKNKGQHSPGARVINSITAELSNKPSLKEKKIKEKTTTFGVNLMRNPVLYRDAQGPSLPGSLQETASYLIVSSSHISTFGQ